MYLSHNTTRVNKKYNSPFTISQLQSSFKRFYFIIFRINVNITRNSIVKRSDKIMKVTIYQMPKYLYHSHMVIIIVTILQKYYMNID